jgi:tannase/feruloyl esterase
MARRRAVTDTNSVIAGLLRDLAAVQKSKQSKWGYARAAEAIAGLAAPIESFLQSDGTLRKIGQVGPSSSRVILEVLQTGVSVTVEHTIAESGKAVEVEKSRGWRDTFLSRAEVLAALGNRRLHGLSLHDCRGDLQMHSTYNSVVQALSGKVQDSYRLFLAPDLKHCGGGPGPSQFNAMGALERWRESNVAPDLLIASHVTSNHVDRTRPLCPYPQVAQYKGLGSTNDAANFACKSP